MIIPDYINCFLRNLYADQEATLRTSHGTTEWFRIRKGVGQDCILSPCLFNFCAEYIIQNVLAGWLTNWNQDCLEKYKKPQICRWHHLYGRKQRGTKEPLDEGERGEWKSWLKTQHSKNKDHDIQSHHFMASEWGEWKSLSCVPLCDPMDCSLPGSPVHGILQARILEWVTYPFSSRSSWPRNQTRVSCIAGRFFTNWAIREHLREKV